MHTLVVISLRSKIWNESFTKETLCKVLILVINYRHENWYLISFEMERAWQLYLLASYTKKYSLARAYNINSTLYTQQNSKVEVKITIP